MNEMTNDAAVAYMTGSWNMRPFVTKMDFGGDETLLHETAKQMHWVPLYSATTVAELRAEVERLTQALHIETHKVITCGVAASHPDASLSRRMEYGWAWDSPQAQEVRVLRERAEAAERRVADLLQAVRELQIAESDVRIHEAMNPRSRNYRLPIYEAQRQARERLSALTKDSP